MDKLDKTFFLRDADTVAVQLLGKKICTNINNDLTCGIVVETESYEGFEDPASHGFSGKTERNYPIFEEGGILYVYLIYGKFYLLNVVTSCKEYPSSVFIRAVKPVNGMEIMKKRRQVTSLYNLANGPGKLTIALGIDRSWNLVPVYNNNKIYFENTDCEFTIQKATRIGISKGKEFLKRFYIKGSRWISTK